MAKTIPHALLVTSIERALAFRELVSDGINDEKLTFLCPSCLQPIRPHKAGGQNPAHFEHKEGKTDCEYAHIDNSSTE